LLIFAEKCIAEYWFIHCRDNRYRLEWGDWFLRFEYFFEKILVFEWKEDISNKKCRSGWNWQTTDRVEEKVGCQKDQNQQFVWDHRYQQRWVYWY